MSQGVVSFVDSYGLIAVLVLMTLESCGIPFPSEVVMPLAGALAAGGHTSLAITIGAGAAANLIGSLVAYLLAAHYGEAAVLGPGRVVGLSRRHLRLATSWFQHYGLLATFLGRLLPAVRTYISFPAGLARVSLPRFALLTLAGSLPWCAGLAAAGYVLGANYQHLSSPIEAVTIVLGIALVVTLAVWVYRGRAKGANDTDVTRAA